MTEFPLVAKADADLTNFVSAFASGTAALATFGVAAGGVATGIGIATAAMVPAVEAAARFQTEIIKLNTLVGISESQMRSFEEAILELGPALGQTPEELARAMFAITSGGERSAAAVDLLEQSAKAARLGLGDTAVIARVGTAALQAFADQGLTASEAIDIMVGTVREGNLVAEELPNAFGRVIGIAGQMGVTFQEVGTFMATFTRLGVSSEIAATSLRAALFAILNPGAEAKKTFDEIGISAEEMRRKIREDGLTDAMLELLAATGGNLDILSDIIPNIRAMSGVLGVYAAQADQVVEIQKNMNDIFGVTNEGFETIQDSFQNATAVLKAEIDTLVVSLGTVFLPLTTQLVRAINIVADTIASTGGAVVDFTNGIIDFGTDAGSALLGLQQDSSETAEKLSKFAEDAAAAPYETLEEKLIEVRAAMERVGEIQKRGGPNAADPEVNNRMNLLIGQEEILIDLMEQRADETIPSVIEGIRVLVGQTDEQIEAVDKLEERLRRQLLTERGLERQILENALAAEEATDAQKRRVLALFDEIEAEKAATEAMAARERQARINLEIMERLSARNERDFARARRRAEEARESEAEKEAALAAELMVSRIEQALDRKADLVQDVSRTVLDSFEDIIDGTKNVSVAFSEMVTDILAEFARMKLEEQILGLLNNLLIPIPEAPGAFAAPTIDPTAGLNVLPSITGPGAVAPAGFEQSKVVVQQSITFAPNLIDARSGRRFIQEQGEAIVELVGRGARSSAGFANSLRG